MYLLLINLVIQLAFAPLGAGNEISIGSDLYLNLFTGPSFLSVVLALINGLMFLPCMFTEFNIAKKEGDFLTKLAVKRKTASASSPSPQEMAMKITVQKKPNKWALIVCVVIFASVQFNFIFLERYLDLLNYFLVH